MMRFLALIAGLCLWVPAYAIQLPDIVPETTWVHLFSRHWDGGDYNEANVGVGLQYDLNADWAIEPGAYWNSHERPSTYLWASYRLSHGTRWEVRGAYGIVDRYNGTKLEDGTADPIVALLAEYHWGRAVNIPGVTAFDYKLFGD